MKKIKRKVFLVTELTVFPMEELNQFVSSIGKQNVINIIEHTDHPLQSNCCIILYYWDGDDLIKMYKITTCRHDTPTSDYLTFSASDDTEGIKRLEQEKKRPELAWDTMNLYKFETEGLVWRLVK